MTIPHAEFPLEAIATGNVLDGRKFANEYVFMFDLIHEGSSKGVKIKNVREFMDSAFFAAFMGSAGKA